MAIEISQDNPKNIYFEKRANAYLKMGRIAECKADLDRAIKLDPGLFFKSTSRAHENSKINISLRKLADAM